MILGFDYHKFCVGNCVKCKCIFRRLVVYMCVWLCAYFVCMYLCESTLANVTFVRVLCGHVIQTTTLLNGGGSVVSSAIDCIII